MTYNGEEAQSMKLQPTQIAGKTLVVGDLHLLQQPMQEDGYVTDWFIGLIQRENPEVLVCNGDTFELPLDLRTDHTTSRPLEIIREILRVHEKLFSAIEQCKSLRQFVLIRGDHDWDLNPNHESCLQSTFQRVKVHICDAATHEATRSLILHGNQLDYNLTSVVVGGSTLTDRLTELFEDYIRQDGAGPGGLIHSVRAAEFSVWYANGKLPAYLRSARELFGLDPGRYVEGLWSLLRSSYFQSWRRALPSRTNRSVAAAVSLAATFPWQTVWWTADCWFFLCEWMYRLRARRLLSGTLDSNIVSFECDWLPANLILSHVHKAIRLELHDQGGQKRAFSTVAPRWHLSSRQKKGIELVRQAAYCVLASNGEIQVKCYTERKCVPISLGEDEPTEYVDETVRH